MNLGLLGEKLSHSYSPAIHKMAMDKLAVSINYQLFERKVDEIPALINEVRNGSIDGFNITIPYKVEVMNYLDEISEQAKSIGACNTVVRDGDKLIGHNTDYFGLLATVKRLAAKVEGEKVVILGTGGASLAAIEVFLNLNVKELYLFKRPEDFYREKGDSRIKIMDYSSLEGIEDASIIVNCTPVGMYPNTANSLVEKSTFKSYSYAIDLIYNPKETLFLKDAREMGLKVANGLYMLVAQALKADELWTNKNFALDDTEDIYSKVEEIVYGGE